MKKYIFLILSILLFSEEKLCSEWDITLSGGEYHRSWFTENYVGYYDYSMNYRGKTNKHSLKCTGKGIQKARFSLAAITLSHNPEIEHINKIIQSIEELHRDGTIEGNFIKSTATKKYKVTWNSECCDELKIIVKIFERD